MAAGYFDKIKERNSEDFVPMSEDAGAPERVDRGVYAAGANYKKGALSLGAIDYYSDDIINIFYTESDLRARARRQARVAIRCAVRDQQAVGDNLLTGTDFIGRPVRPQDRAGAGPALLTAAYTDRRWPNMQNPWSGYPGYTSVQVEDFNRAGEDAWMLRARLQVPEECRA